MQCVKFTLLFVDINGVDIKTEIRAGITTFFTMSYIIFVNPAILSQAGVPKEGAMFATCIASAIATFIMGIYANYPFALAPGMGLNAYFTYGVVQGMGYSWQVALGAVFIEGLIFILITSTGLRTQIVKAIPASLRLGTSVGIGLFIAFIGLKNAQVVVSSSATFVKLGKLNTINAIIFFASLFAAGALLAKGFRGAILVSIIAVTLIEILLGNVALPKSFAGIPSPSSTFMKLDLSGIRDFTFWKVVLAFLFVDLFDTVGTLTACGVMGGFYKGNEFPRVDRALFADAVGTTVGAILGTSTVTTYIESSAGIAEGGKTGITAIVVAVLFVASLFVYPLVKLVPEIATAPALVLVGVMMASSVKEINWQDMTEAIPAFLTMFFMPITYSIANGLAVGFISYPIVKLLTGRKEEVTPLMWLLCLIFLVKFFA